MMRAVAVRRASDAVAGEKPASGSAILQHDERHLRRRVIELSDGGKVLVDLPGTVVLEGGDALVTDDGDVIDIIAATEPLYEIHARDSLHLTELSWHLGNRHLAAAIETNRILILRDHVIRAMLEGLGARITEIMSEFQPVRGAYSGDGGHAHTHGSSHDNTVSHAAHGSANGHSHDGHAHDSHGHHHHSHDAQTHTTGPHSALDHHHD